MTADRWTKQGRVTGKLIRAGLPVEDYLCTGDNNNMLILEPMRSMNYVIHVKNGGVSANEQIYI